MDAIKNNRPLHWQRRIGYWCRLSPGSASLGTGHELRLAQHSSCSIRMPSAADRWVLPAEGAPQGGERWRKRAALMDARDARCARCTAKTTSPASRCSIGSSAAVLGTGRGSTANRQGSIDHAATGSALVRRGAERAPLHPA
eukprot:362858-Chlamydomonas_euryale.AAC.7